MFVQLISGEVFGIDGRVVDIEIDVHPGVFKFILSGLAGKGIRDSRERIRAAILNSGYDFPVQQRVLVNLAPAAFEKDGTYFDLPIALGVLMANGQLRSEIPEAWGVLGELSLDGDIRPVHGVLSLVTALRDRGVERVLIPMETLDEACVVPGVRCIGVRTLRHAAEVIRGNAPGIEPDPARRNGTVTPPAMDFGQVIGHRRVKRALALAAAGWHNVLLVGPPGSGKTLLARCLPGVLPPMSSEERLEVTRIHSAAGTKVDGGLMRQRPFRAPHHTVSWAGLVGGGVIPRPGEITLAHRGVLFLDELPEYPRRALEALREPLEEGSIQIVRAKASLEFPALLLLVAAMNPCPCGHHQDPQRRCTCSPDRVRRYRERISGPFLDRIDMRLAAPSPSSEEILSGRGDDLDTKTLRKIVTTAMRFRRRHRRLSSNALLQWKDRAQWAPVTSSAGELLSKTVREAALSTRGLTRILRLARTIADADEQLRIDDRHLLEAFELHSGAGGDGVLDGLV